MMWLCVLCIVLLFILVIMFLKITVLHRELKNMQENIDTKLHADTNTMLTVSCNDKYIKKFAAKLNTQLTALRDEKIKFENGDNDLRQAITNISHDLRTPLTAICGYLDLLKNEEKSKNVSRYISVIENRTESLKRLTEELFRYSVISSTVNDTDYCDVTINSVLEESISAFYAALTQRNITPNISICDQKVVRKLDTNALSRIFENIIGNAIKYSDGDLLITLSPDSKIVFSNTASKLSSIEAGKLFDRFYTVEDAHNSTGLGLSIAKLLTEHMGGQINAEYKNGQLRIIIFFKNK